MLEPLAKIDCMQLLKNKLLIQPSASRNNQRTQETLQRALNPGLVVIMNQRGCFGEIKSCDEASLYQLQW